MFNRERILVAALALFNDAGTAPISTNHIAAAAGISPGNLYYHFRNKDQIIQALFERLFSTFEHAFVLPLARPPTLDDLRHFVRVNFEVLWEYRFAYRELAALLRRDEVLRERWLEVRRRGYVGFRDLVAAFVSAGVLAVPAPGVVDRIADLCWLISEFWLPSLEVSGQPVDAPQYDRGVALMLQVLNPYLDPAEVSEEIMP